MGYPGPMSSGGDPNNQCGLSWQAFMTLGGFAGTWTAIYHGAWWWALLAAAVCIAGFFLWLPTLREYLQELLKLLRWLRKWLLSL